MENPYSSPENYAETVVDAPRFRVVAVIVGFVADIVFSTVAGIVLAIMATVPLMMSGVRPENVAAELSRVTWLLWATLLVGTLGTMFGGYVAALMGKCWPVRHAAATGILSTLLSLTWIMVSPEAGAEPSWFTMLGLLAALPAALLGGYLRMGRSTSTAEQAEY